MDVLLTLQEAAAYKRPSVVALGMFDGVHRGHCRLLETAVARAKSLGLASMAVTFDRHPLSVVFHGAGPSLLTTNEEKTALIKDIGLDAVFFLPFDEKTSQMAPETFIKEIVVGLLNARVAVVGFNYSFGKGGLGDPRMLAALGEKHGFDVVCIEPETLDGEVISSSLIRELVVAGEMPRANAMLGRAYAVKGRVVKGDGRGTGLGFPTANLEVPLEKTWPADGVYACRCRAAAGEWPGVASIGTKPTFAGKLRTLEAFLDGFHGNLYGDDLEVAFVDRLRGILVFDGPDALARQIARDVEQARGRLQKV